MTYKRINKTKSVKKKSSTKSHSISKKSLKKILNNKSTYDLILLFKSEMDGDNRDKLLKPLKELLIERDLSHWKMTLHAYIYDRLNLASDILSEIEDGDYSMNIYNAERMAELLRDNSKYHENMNDQEFYSEIRAGVSEMWYDGKDEYDLYEIMNRLGVEN